MTLGSVSPHYQKKAKIGYPHLNSVLNGHRPITRQFVQAVSEHLGKPTDWFYEDHSKPALPSAPEHASVHRDFSSMEIAMIFSRMQTATPAQKALVLTVLYEDPAYLDDFEVSETLLSSFLELLKAR